MRYYSAAPSIEHMNYRMFARQFAANILHASREIRLHLCFRSTEV